jgi:cytochrome c oxidase assembly protein subunit 15
MGILFIGQAIMGWLMVASGLVDQPAVSHFRLTLHLLLALSLFALALWTALGHKFGFLSVNKKKAWSSDSKLALTSFIVLVIQIAYGGMTAGLKAGHVSNTWPLMLGKLIPPNLFNSWINLLETPQTIVFIHRWFAWVSAALVVSLYIIARKKNYPAELQKGLIWAVGIVAFQILLGILTVLLNVQIAIALLHQANAIALFGISLFIIHRLRAVDNAVA